jgi:hypothetical protein
MSNFSRRSAAIALATLALGIGAAARAATFPLDSVKGLKLENVKGEPVTWRGRRAVRLTEAPVPPGTKPAADDAMAILTESDFGDGTIEVDVAGAPRPGAVEGARGFIGIAFHVQDGSHYEYFYLRPTNGRSDDQLRRNHASQYASAPDYPWQRLRKESPGVYESYVDLEPGVWTRIRIVVSGTEARFFVHESDQPILVVHDLKLGKTRGKIALWIGLDTEGYFSNLVAR